MRALLAAIGRRLDLVGPGHAAGILALLWLLTVVVTWIAAEGAR